MRNAERTGKIRYRVEHRWRKPDVLVLQHEWRGTVTVMELGSQQITTEWATEWHDARVQDLTVGNSEQQPSLSSAG